MSRNAQRISGWPVYKDGMNRRAFSECTWRCGIVTLLLIAMMPVAAASAQERDRSRRPKVAEPSLIAQHYRPLLDADLERIANGGDVDAGSKSLQHVFDDIAVRADAGEHDLFIDAAAAMRLTWLVYGAEESTRAPMMEFLLEHDEFARALAFTADPGADDVDAMFALIERLRERHADSLDSYASLAAAICVVHDKPLKRGINENMTVAPDPVALYEYFVVNEEHLVFPVRNMPAELLIYVVDSTASIDDMRWALSKYRNHRKIGELFFSIEYDYDHLKGERKKVTEAGFNLPNIARHGGVCADQAYFACAVGKSIGVPTTYTVGASGEVAHAWVGFLESTPRAAWWNFSSGRYEAYQGVRGVVIDPQKNQRVPDSTIALLAEYATAGERERYATIAMTDAAIRLLDASDGRTIIPFEVSETEYEPVRSATQKDGLELLEQALRTCPGYATAWFTVATYARHGEFSFEEKQKWATVLHRLCGEKYPDFYFAVVAPMIESVDDVEEQNRMWNAAFRTFQKRHDLAAAVRMQQAEMWKKHGDNSKAGQCCEDVITRYANAGPFVLHALQVATSLLAEMNKRERIPALYEKAWALTKKPDTSWAPEFYRQSNWYRIGVKYSEELAKVGRGGDATNVRTAIGAK
jgi:hypothetical protein